MSHPLVERFSMSKFIFFRVMALIYLLTYWSLCNQIQDINSRRFYITAHRLRPTIKLFADDIFSLISAYCYVSYWKGIARVFPVFKYPRNKL